jgi:uncharacterized cupredoxin-like copper-binding protein
MHMMTVRHSHALVLGCFLAFSTGTAAHDDAAPSAKQKRAGSPQQTAFGREAGAARATRTIKVDMSDTMRFSPDTIQIRTGSVVRFEVTNTGNALHEMVLGTMKELKEHAELMRKHPGMEHDEPYMAHVAPGKTGSIVWAFTKSGEFFYGCLIPGHFEAGMIGKIIVR